MNVTEHFYSRVQDSQVLLKGIKMYHPHLLDSLSMPYVMQSYIFLIKQFVVKLILHLLVYVKNNT